MNKYRELANSVHLRFQSGNDVPIERAHITAAEWALIQPALFREGVLAEIESGIFHTCGFSHECEACDAEAK